MPNMPSMTLLPRRSLHLILPRPLLDSIKVLTPVLRVEVRRGAALGTGDAVQEGCDVCKAHEADAQGVDAVVDVLGSLACLSCFCFVRLLYLFFEGFGILLFFVAVENKKRKLTSRIKASSS